MRELRIVLPDDVAAAVEQQISLGGFADASAVVEDSIRMTLMSSVATDQESDVEQWLLDEVVPAYQAYLDDPSDVVPAAEMLDWIKRNRASS